MRSAFLARDSFITRSSPLARLACLVYALLLLYGGLTPLSGWHDKGVSPFAYLTAPVPLYVTGFDLWVNVVAYMPLGALIVLALHPRVRGVLAVGLALVVGSLLSGSVEAIQTYLPSRVASNIDLATNALGTLLGAISMAPFASNMIDRGRMLELRLRWFERDATIALIIVALWPAAQIFPGPMLFANGALNGALSALLESLGAIVPRWAPQDFSPADYVLAEAFVVTAALLTAGLAFASAMSPAAPRVRLLLLMLLAALAARSLSNGVNFAPDRSFSWVTPGAVGGLLLGTLAMSAASFAPPAILRRVALLSALLLLIAVNVVPDNPYHLASLQEWRQGRLLNFNALTRWVSTAWPLVLLLWLLTHLSARRSANANSL